MAWSFLDPNNNIVKLTDYQDEHDPDKGIFYDPSINYDNCGDDTLHPLTGVTLRRLTVEQANQIEGIKPFDMDLRGPNWPNKDIVMDDRRKKALAKNPMHSTMEDYKLSNPNSIPAKSRKRTRDKLKRKGVNIKTRES
jgi:hypothetical protein